MRARYPPVIAIASPPTNMPVALADMIAPTAVLEAKLRMNGIESTRKYPATRFIAAK